MIDILKPSKKDDFKIDLKENYSKFQSYQFLIMILTLFKKCMNENN